MSIICPPIETLLNTQHRFWSHTVSSLYVEFAHSSRGREADHSLLASKQQIACRLSTDKIERLATRHLSGFVIHHGHIRSSGIIKQESRTLLVIGSPWIEHSDTTLATPFDILQHISEHGFTDERTLHGHYVFVYHDSETDLFVVENDHLGTYPLYLRSSYGCWHVATQLKILSRNGDTPDITYIAEVLRFGHSVTDRSPLASVRRIMPNQRLRIDRGDARIIGLTDLQHSGNTHASPDIYSALTDTFQRYISRFAADTRRLNVSLSGGLDSRIALLAAQTQRLNLTATTSGEGNSLECKIAKQVASSANVPIHIHKIDCRTFAEWFPKAVWITEGRCPPEHLHFLPSLLSGEYYATPQIHGLVGDLVIGGDFEDISLLSAEPKQIESACRQSMRSFVYWPQNSLQATLTPDLSKLVDDTDEEVSRRIFDQISFQGEYSDYLRFRHIFRAHGFTVPCLCSQVLPWADIVAPYTDPHYLSLAASLNHTELANRHLQLQWALRAYPMVALTPRLKDGVLLDIRSQDSDAYNHGLSILRKKQSFRYYLCRLSRGRLNLPFPETYPAYSQWYRKSRAIRDFVHATLLSDQCLARGLWRRDGIASLLHDLRIGRNTWAAVGSILTLELLFRQLIDKSEAISSELRPPNPTFN
jgi:hypothetical protein